MPPVILVLTPLPAAELPPFAAQLPIVMRRSVSAVEPTGLEAALRDHARATPDAVLVLDARYTAALGMPSWLAQLPALAETRLLLPAASEIEPLAEPALRAWCSVVDAVVAMPPAETPPWAAHRLEPWFMPQDAAQLLAACQPLPGPSRAPQIVTYASCEMPTVHGTFDVKIFHVDGEENALLVSRGPLTASPLFVRIHSECFTGEVLASLKCDCDHQLHSALREIADRDCGAVVYLRQEGRGIGLGNKILAYAEQALGADTVEANVRLGFPVDQRDFTAAAQILRTVGAQRIELATNNPRKVRTLRRSGLTVERVLPAFAPSNPHSHRYLQVKCEQLGHVGLMARNGDKAPTKPLAPKHTLLIFDLDGVLQFDRRVHAEASDLIAALRRAGYTLRFLTNDAFNSRQTRLRELHAGGLHIADQELYTASYLAARFVEDRGPLLVLGSEAAAVEFAHLPQSRTAARTVVVGDWFHHYEGADLQAAFDAVQRGAELIAVHRKPRWSNAGKLLIDVGFWVAGLEHCTGQQATIVGKPAAFAYETVLADAGYAADHAVMISDEPDPDLRGAAAAGLATILFGTEHGSGPDHASLGTAASYRQLRQLLQLD